MRKRSVHGSQTSVDVAVGPGGGGHDHDCQKREREWIFWLIPCDLKMIFSSAVLEAWCCLSSAPLPWLLSRWTFSDVRMLLHALRRRVFRRRKLLRRVCVTMSSWNFNSTSSENAVFILELSARLYEHVHNCKSSTTTKCLTNVKSWTSGNFFSAKIDPLRHTVGVHKNRACISWF